MLYKIYQMKKVRFAVLLSASLLLFVSNHSLANETATVTVAGTVSGTTVKKQSSEQAQIQANKKAPGLKKATVVPDDQLPSATGRASGAPTGVATATGHNKVTISWHPVNGAGSYNLYWSENKTAGKSSGNKIAGVSSPFVHDNLKNGRTYHYIVTSVSSGGESVASSDVIARPIQPVPAAPSSVTAIQGDGKINVRWNAVKTATSYNIYWSLDKKFTRSSGHKVQSVTSPYPHINLANGTSYYYAVTAVNSGGESALSSIRTVAPQVVAPAAPTSVLVVAGERQVRLRWARVAGADSYNLYWSVKRGVTKKNGKKIENVTPGTEYTELTNGTEYFYIVTALNAGGESAASKEVSTVPQVSTPAAPAEVNAVPRDGKIMVSWMPVEGASTYNIYWSENPDVTDKTGKVIKNLVSSTFTQLELKNAKKYYFVVTAVNAGGESAFSRKVFAIPRVAAPSVPTNIVIEPGNGKVTIEWKAVAGATRYNLYWSVKAGVKAATAKKVADIKQKQSLSGLINGTQYFYVITAENAGGESAASIELSAIPQVPAPSVPAGVAAVSLDQSVSFAWDEAVGATSYNLYWSTKPGVTPENGTRVENISAKELHSGLLNGVNYFYVITAVNAGGESAPSTEMMSVPQVPAPHAPKGITAKIADRKVILDWKTTPGATSYNIYWNQKGGVTTKDVKIKAVTAPYTHTGLKNGETYFYIISAVNTGGETVSHTASVTLLPDAPAFTQPKGGDEQVVLDWGQVDNAKSYSLYWDTVPNVTTSSNRIVNVSSPYTHSALTNGLTYYYIVTANNVSGGAASKEAKVTLAPDAPVISTVTGGDKQVKLTLTRALGATTYHLYWNTTGNVSKEDEKIKKITPEFIHSSLINGTTYYYKITAQNAGGESDLSEEVNVTLIPDAPVISKAMVVDASITLNWAVMHGATSYHIYWNNTGNVTGKDNKITSTDIASVLSPYAHPDLERGTTYYYVVTAQNSGGESKLSAVSAATLAPGVPAISSLKGSNNQVTINWNAMHGATSYNIYWSNEPGVDLKSTKLKNVYNANIKDVAPNYLHTRLPNGIAYYYRVTAVNAGGESGQSAEMSIVLPPDAPVITSAAGGDTTTSLIWNAVNHAQSYTIYWGTRKGVNAQNEKIINAVSPYSFTNLENRRPYYYAITSNNSGGESLLSIEASATPHNRSLSRLFKDPKLQQCINELAESRKWQYADQIVGSVSCGSSGIKNLSGIEFLINITKLSLKNNSISDLEPLSGLSKLTSLSLNSNSISNIEPLGNLNNLTSLHLHNNDISDVSAFSSLGKLNYLSLYKNSISDVSGLSGLRQLTSLYLNSNKIRDVSPLKNLVNLTFLDLGRNNIGGKGVGRVDSLTSLGNVKNMHLTRNPEISCDELSVLVTTLGSPPVDTDGISSNFDVATAGTNCTKP